jgi:pyruvate-formate lyase-activating enzyme
VALVVLRFVRVDVTQIPFPVKKTEGLPVFIKNGTLDIQLGDELVAFRLVGDLVALDFKEMAENQRKRVQQGNARQKGKR